MIAVIADDLTGAAEIAGIGWRHGLKTVILRRTQKPVSADLLIYDTNSRHCLAREAARRVAMVARRLKRSSPVWIYKKVDSVLRGNVLTELEALCTAAGRSHCLLVPANPTAQRVIKSGRYLVRGTPIDQTDFRNDPTHPRRSANVRDLLRSETRAIHFTLRRRPVRTLLEGIVLGEAASANDLKGWARYCGTDLLAAGGGEFFTALLKQRGMRLKRSHLAGQPDSGETRLFVCGSLAAGSIQFIKRRRLAGWPVLAMPHELLAGRTRVALLRQRWADEIRVALACHPKAVMTTGQPVLTGQGSGRRVERILGEVVCEVLATASPKQVCVEGGATAAALLSALNWTRLTVLGEFSPGVTALQLPDYPRTSFILKPGSYAWPAVLLA